jgi:benzoate-CoA ligase
MADASAISAADPAVAPYNAAADLVGRNLAAGRAGKPAFFDDSGRYTYAELEDRVARCAHALRALDIAPGARIVLGLLDGIDFPVAFLGAIRAGIVPIPVNTLFPAADLGYILADSGAAAAIVSADLLPRFREAAVIAEWPGRLVVSGDAPAGDLDFARLVGNAARHEMPHPARPDDPCFWLYSSGSTGRPKGTVHRQASLVRTAECFAEGVLGLHEGDLVYSAAKLFFAYGLGNALTFPLAVGAASVLASARPTPDLVGDILRTHPVTLFCGVPTLYAALLAHPGLPPRAAMRLRLCLSAGEALPDEIGRAWTARTGTEIVDGIGSTEMLHIFVSNRPGAVRYGTTGTPVPGYEVRLLDEAGAEVADDAIGELQVRGPTAASFYWNNPDKSRATFLDGGWVRTGDKFRREADGALVYCGRADDMLKVGGIWVSPAEIEAALLGHPAILEVAVIGKADDGGLIKPKAFIVLKDGARPAPDAAELQAFVKARLAPYKYPRWVDFVPELPKTATGKIRRHVLREQEESAAPGAAS